MKARDSHVNSVNMLQEQGNICRGIMGCPRRNQRIRTPRKKEDEEIFWPCDYCDYKTKRRYELKLHFAADHEGKRFYCELCDFSAKRKDTLNCISE